MRAVSRREFLKAGVGGAATIVVGSKLGWLGASPALAATQVLDVTITDCMREMVTHNEINEALCYFWIYKMNVTDANFVPVHDIPPEYPGPTIVAAKGDTITIRVTNTLDEPHSFFIPGIVDSGPIAADGGVWNSQFTVNELGTWLYYDNLNEPVNRVMGLHGALVVMPDHASPPAGHNFTPYENPTPAVQQLYDDFGNSEHFPGLAWHEGDSSEWALSSRLGQSVVNCPPFRTYVWLTHEASPNLFAAVGSMAPGEVMDPEEFKNRFLRDTFSPTRDNDIPQYFMINGQSGMFAHDCPTMTPFGRVGEPVVVHILSAGLWTHSMHLHANHFYVTSVNGVPAENVLWVDVYHVEPMDRIDYTIPFMRPPDIGTVRGIGLPEEPLRAIAGHYVWPPIQEMDMYIPAPGEWTAWDQTGTVQIDLKQRMSPLCFPMHDHSEASQTSQGGNYNCGLISGIYFTGDRNTPGFMDFPMDDDFLSGFQNIRGIHHTELAAGHPHVHIP
jgi:FtsP/CotA-like multicopper oxidase with cupredoxin domain